MNIAELIIEDARQRGIEHFFGLPGSGCPMDLMEAGRQRDVQFVPVAHESSAAVIAAFYGLIKGTPGLSLAIKGVGAGNLVAGAVNAYFERLGVICVCERSPMSVTQREMCQHCSHTELFRPVSNYVRTLNPEDAPTQVQEAVFRAGTYRPGPVLLDLPSDLGAAEAGDPLPPRQKPAPPSPLGDHLENARKMIEASSRPMIIAGPDIITAGARDELKQLAENLDAVVMANLNARGVIPESHPRWAGNLAGINGPNIIEAEVYPLADMVIVIGADPMMTIVPWYSDLPVCEFVETPELVSYTPNPQVRVDGDLKQAMQALLSINKPGIAEADIAAARQTIEANYRRPGEAKFALNDVMEISRQVLPADGVMFSETGAFINHFERLWVVDEPGRCFTSSGGRSMGLMVPSVLGAKLADADLPAMGIGADGSLLMRLGELEVFGRTGAAAPLVIINDQALGTMKSRQKDRGMPDYALDYYPVDYAAVAHACGLHGVMVDTPEAYETELKKAMSADKATLIDARIDAGPFQDAFGPTIGAV